MIFLLLLGLAAGPLQARAADRTISIRQVSVYPEDSPGFNKLGGFTWPDVKSLSVLVKLETGGFTGEQKFELFLVLFDEDNDVVQKTREKYFLPAGKHDIVFPNFISTAQVFGPRSFSLKAEAALEGAQPAKAGVPLVIEGPEPPRIELLELEIYSPTLGNSTSNFGPGDEFAFSALIEVGKNESSIKPRLRIYSQVEEEESYEIDPDESFQQYSQHWDEIALPSTDGVFEVTAVGRLPYFFSRPWDFTHSFRVWAMVGFGDRHWKSDYARARLTDQGYGEARQSDKVEDRLIELSRGYQWQVRHLRRAREWAVGAAEMRPANGRPISRPAFRGRLGAQSALITPGAVSAIGIGGRGGPPHWQIA